MKMHSSNLTDIGCDDIIYLLVQSSQFASLLMDLNKERHQTTPGRMAQLVEPGGRNNRLFTCKVCWLSW